MRIGLFGGTFDPIHAGHVAVAAEVCSRLGLDSVRFVPCRRPPHKARPQLTHGADRLAMIALGTQEMPRLVPSSAELRRPAPSYTIDTLRAMSAEEPDNRFFFIMGTDSFREIGTWKQYEELISQHHLVVVDRPTHGPQPREEELPEAVLGRLVDADTDTDAPEGRIHILEVVPRNVSATEVRSRAARGQELGALVPDPVAAYIRKCVLYRA